METALKKMGGLLFSRADSPRTALLGAGFISLCVIGVFSGLSRGAFGYGYHWSAMTLDLLLLWPLLTAVRWYSRVRGADLCLGMVLCFFAVLGHAIKYQQLGVPLAAADAGPAFQLLAILAGWRKLLACVVVAVSVLFVITLLMPDRKRTRWLVLLPLAIVLLPVMAGLWSRLLLPSDADHTDPRQVGGIAYLATDIGKHVLSRDGAPSRDAVEQILATLPIAKPAQELKSLRNVHMVLLETLWDPTQLANYQFSRDPWDARFRQWWRMGGGSHVLSPAFGGATANAEFEILCGLPADSGKVVFEADLENFVGCLPRLLRDSGYNTIASHPYKVNFWGRSDAYRRLGFGGYYPVDSYLLDDMDGMFLNDASTYRQTRERERGIGSPLFSYVVSLSSHYPFDRDEKLRPDVVTVFPSDALLSKYANAIAYSTAAFMDYVQDVLSNDPNALIVAFGDHAPVLGSNPNPYVVGGLRGSDDGDNLVALASTPLLVIDGENGPLPMGDVPLYAVPGRLLPLLGGSASLLHKGVVGAFNDSSRVFLNQTLVNGQHGWRACHGNEAECVLAKQQIEGMRTLRDDIVLGQQYSLIARAGKVPGPISMDISQPFASCGMQVESWGPTSTGLGQPFNPQAGGRNAFWFKVVEARGDLLLKVAGNIVPVTVAGKSASASFLDPDFIRRPGSYSLELFCDGNKPVVIGDFNVTRPVPLLASVSGDPAVEPVPESAKCSFEVEAWGPKFVHRGQSFNSQPDGASALWFKYKALHGVTAVRIGEHAASLHIGQGGLATAAFTQVDLTALEGDYPVTAVCNDIDITTELGSFSVLPPA